MTVDRSYLEQRAAKYLELIEAMENTILELSEQKVQSYELETSEGRQRATDKQLLDAQRALRVYERNYEHYCNRLQGLGMVSIRLRRK